MTDTYVVLTELYSQSLFDLVVITLETGTCRGTAEKMWLGYVVELTSNVEKFSDWDSESLGENDLLRDAFWCLGQKTAKFD